MRFYIIRDTRRGLTVEAVNADNAERALDDLSSVDSEGEDLEIVPADMCAKYTIKPSFEILRRTGNQVAKR